MQFFGFFLILFGILILITPELLAYIIAFLFIIIGGVMLSISFKITQLKNKPQNAQVFSFGDYEFIRKK